MVTLAFENAVMEDAAILIPFAHDPCSRVRINANRDNAVIEHEYCDFFLHNGEEVAEWVWRPAARQLNADEINSILKELRQYAENEIFLSHAVC